jgi:hypothetical protein
LPKGAKTVPPHDDLPLDELFAASRARARDQHVVEQFHFHDWIVAGRAYKRIPLPQRMSTGHAP